MRRRKFLEVGVALAAGSAWPVGAQEREGFTVTLDLLKSWGACPRALAWFSEAYPKGVTDTISGLLSRMPEEWPHDRTWFLHETAKRVDGPQGDEALALLVAQADPSRLAKAVTDITRRDTREALDRLKASGDAAGLVTVIKAGPEAAAIEAAAALGEVESLERLTLYAAELPTDRVSLLQKEK